MGIGFRVQKRRRAADMALAARFSALPVANVSDMMGRMAAGGAALRPYHDPSVRLAGPALTVKTRPGDNLMIHKALNMAEAGDVIVVDAGGDLTNALIGDIMVSLACKKNLGGFVIHGAVRDIVEIRESGLPIYAAGVTHRGPFKDGPGEVNVPIAIDGMVIEPGDLMIGDGDGVLCVPYDQIEAILAVAEGKLEAERKELDEIADGTIDRSWVDRILRERGCEIEE